MEKSIIKFKEEIIYWSKRLYEKNMSPATSGNVSIKINEDILISSSGVCLGDMKEDDIVLIDENGNLISGAKKPSSESIMHTQIYSQRNDIKAIIHSHCPVITAFAVAGVEITEEILPDFVFLFNKIPLVPYFCPSSLELANAVSQKFREYNAILMQNHGVVIGADSLKNAFYKLESLKAYCETYFNAKLLGGAKTLNKNQIDEIKTLIK